MDKLKAILEQGILSELGWALSVAEHESQLGYDTPEECAHETAKVIADVMKPVLAGVYAEAFGEGFDLAADDSGAWAQIQDYPEDIPSEYHNPFEESK